MSNINVSGSDKTVPALPLSVLLVAYNAEQYVTEVIESVLAQSFTDFELLFIDDGSTDATVRIASSFQDSRIKLHQRKHNYIASLNYGLSIAQGKYVARMDADDLMHRDRLRIQYAIMEAEPTLSICGTWMRGFTENIRDGKRLAALSGVIDKPLHSLLHGNFFYHPTMIFRASFFHDHHLHYEKYPYAEDYKLWFEAAKQGALFYIEPQELYYYRFSSQQVSSSKKKEQNQTRQQIQKEILLYLISKHTQHSLLKEIYCNMAQLVSKKIITQDVLLAIFRAILDQDKDVFVNTPVSNK